jgi:ABC-type sugar transport system ATPase subunit
MRLTVRGIRKAFGATIALDGVDFTAAEGEVHALVGENGAGKSTLMKVLAGACRPDAGDLALDGQPYHPVSPLDARRHGVAMVYQELSLAPHLTVEENVLLGREPGRCGFLARRQMRDRVQAVLAQLGQPDLRPDARVGDLPPAAQQVTEIARALAQAGSHAGDDTSRCRILILDEPTSSLAADAVDRLFAVIERLKREDVTIIYISHVLEEVSRIADRFTVLRDGRSVGGGLVSETTPSEIVHLMAGRQLSELFPRSVRQPGEVVLDLREVAGVRKPRSVSLQLRRGEVLGIGGLVGAGRTELLRVIFALDPVRSGEIRVASNRPRSRHLSAVAALGTLPRHPSAVAAPGTLPRHPSAVAAPGTLPRHPSAVAAPGTLPEDPGPTGKRRVGTPAEDPGPTGHRGPATPRRRLRQGVGFLSEDRKGEGLMLSRSVADNMTLSRLEGLGPWRLVLPRRQRQACSRWIGELSIRCADSGQPVVELSGGNQQKVALARLLHHDVDVLLLDEPTRGIDVASKAQIYEVIDRLAAAGKAILLVSSYLPELLGVCDRIAMMTRGVLGPARPAGELDQHQLLMEATGQA